MAKKAKHSEMNLYYVNNGQAERKRAEEEERKRKEREKRIKESKKERQNDEFDLDTETVIQMTNKNKLKKDEERRKIQNKKEIKRRKRNKKIKMLLKLFLFIGIITGGTAFAFTSPIFNIKEIQVINNEIVPSDTIVSLSELKTEENIFKFISVKAMAKIKENPYIENVKIHRKLPSTIEIEVEERKPKYNIKLLESYAYITTQGYILEISTEGQNMPVIQGVKTPEEEITAGKRLNNEDLEKLEDVIKIMDALEKYELNQKVTSIDINEKNGYIIYIEEEKKTIHLGDSTNLNDKIRNVVKIMEKEKDKEGEIFVNGDLNNKFQPYFREKV